jgi:dienelactone hydrolase
MGDYIHYRDGEAELTGILEPPHDHNGRAVLVVHEANGLGDNVRRRTRMLAELGYIALAADLYGGAHLWRRPGGGADELSPRRHGAVSKSGPGRP